MCEIETSLMVNDYPEPPEVKTKDVTFEVYVKLTFKDVELLEDETPEDYIQENGILDYDDYEVEDVQTA